MKGGVCACGRNVWRRKKREREKVIADGEGMGEEEKERVSCGERMRGDGVLCEYGEERKEYGGQGVGRGGV